MMPTKLLLFVAGLLLLVKGADFFVKAAASLAKKLGVSDFVIGLTLVALGTSVPELASALAAVFKKQGGLVLGTVIGANVANLLLITGLAAALAAVRTRREMIGRDGYIMLGATSLFCLFAWNGTVSRLEAAAMLLVYVAYTLFLFTAKAGMEEQYGFRRFLNYLFRFQYILTIKHGVLAGLGRTEGGRDGKRRRPEDRAGFPRGRGQGPAGDAGRRGGDRLRGRPVHRRGGLFCRAAEGAAGAGRRQRGLAGDVAARDERHRVGRQEGLRQYRPGQCPGLVHRQHRPDHRRLGPGLAAENEPRRGCRCCWAFCSWPACCSWLFIRSAWRIRRWEGAILLAFYAAYAALLFFVIK